MANGEALRSDPRSYDALLHCIYKKKEGIDLKTIRRVSIRLVFETEVRPIDLVDVVSPIDAIGHPQLIRALRRPVTTGREGSRIFYRYVLSALLKLTCAVLESCNDASRPVKLREQALYASIQTTARDPVQLRAQAPSRPLTIL